MAGYSDLSTQLTSGTSAIIDLGTATLVGIYIPSISSVTVKFSQFNPLTSNYDVVSTPLSTADTIAGSDLALTVAASTVRYYPIPPTVTAGLSKFKIVTNASDTALLGYKVRNI